jgi:CheY-like chemotaxis protein
MKKICFIDDREDEIQLFKDAFADKFEIVAQTSFEECAKEMAHKKWKKPDLFVLDLYFPKGKSDGAVISALRATPVEFVADDGVIEKAMQNYERANARLESILQAHRQSPDGGIDLARLARKQYPRVPTVFYSRNPTADDYLRAMKEPKVLDLIPKLPWPQGTSEEDKRKNAKASGGSTADRFLRATEPPKDNFELLKKSIEIVWKVIQYLPKL